MNEEPTPETLQHLVEVQPMRRLISHVCNACKYEWVQPAVGGKCPKCHMSSEIVGSPRISALRVV